jgi:hypothetical protein
MELRIEATLACPIMPELIHIVNLLGGRLVVWRRIKSVDLLTSRIIRAFIFSLCPPPL